MIRPFLNSAWAKEREKILKDQKKAQEAAAFLFKIIDEHKTKKEESNGRTEEV